MLYVAPMGFVFPVCIKLYYQKYSVNYPIVFSVRDMLTGYEFNFATEVFIDGFEPGECGQAGIGAAVCTELNCSASVDVVDWRGLPVEGVLVTFGGCPLGRTDANGHVEGAVACGEYELQIIKPGYGVHKEVLEHSMLNRTYTLRNVPELNFTFYQSCDEEVEGEQILLNFYGAQNFTVTNLEEADLEGCLYESGYWAECKDCQDCLNTSGFEVCEQNPNCTIYFREVSKCQKGYLTSRVTVDYIPAGSYRVSAMVMNPEMSETYSGGKYSFVGIPLNTKEYNIEIPDSGGVVNVYVPDSDRVYRRAIDKYDDEYGDCRKYGIWPKNTEEYCKGEAMKKALKRNKCTSRTVL